MSLLVRGVITLSFRVAVAYCASSRENDRPGVQDLVGAIGLEPTTPTMSRWCSNQLSYAPESGQFYLMQRSGSNKERGA